MVWVQSTWKLIPLVLHPVLNWVVDTQLFLKVKVGRKFSPLLSLVLQVSALAYKASQMAVKPSGISIADSAEYKDRSAFLTELH